MKSNEFIKSIYVFIPLSVIKSFTGFQKKGYNKEYNLGFNGTP